MRWKKKGEDEIPVIFEDGDNPMPRVLGDIMISIERAAEQAEEYGHSYDRELGFLAVHGFLHINGYDHMTPEDEKEMFGLQKEIWMPMDLKDKNVEKNKHFLMSVEFALQGVKTVFEEERNMRKHVAFGLFALLMGVVFQL